MTLPNRRMTNKTPRRLFNPKSANAVKQAPWRSQMQFAGLFLLGLIIILLVASVYLSISGRAAAAGLESYYMSIRRQNIEREIADRKSQIALLTSVTVMEKRAKDMGFKRIDPTEAEYITIPGYTGRQTVVLASPPGIDETKDTVVIPAYRQSLWDWMFQGINRLSASVGGEIR